MDYRFINPDKSLGKATKAYLRAVSGYKRLVTAQIPELVFANNQAYEQQQQAKKEQKKQQKQVLQTLPNYVEQNEAQQKQLKAQRKKEQKQQAINQFEARLTKNILEKQGGKYVLKLNSFLRKFSNNKLAIKQILKSISKVLFPDKKINLKVNNLHYALNAYTIERLYALLSSQLVEGINVSGSDEAFVTDLQDAEQIEIYEFVKKNKYEKANGAFFKYNHKLDFDLTNYQIYNSMDYHYKKVNYENCLAYALMIGGLSNEKLAKLLLLSKTDNIPVCKLNDICDKLEIRINLKKSKKGDYGFFNFGEKYEETYTLGLLDEHYFIIEQLKITSYAIKNYEAIKNKKDWFKIIKANGDKSNERFIDSFDVVRLLLDLKDTLLKALNKTDILDSPYYKKVDDEITNLTYAPMKGVNFKPIEPKEEGLPKMMINVFYDFETHTDQTGKHIPYLCCYRVNGKCYTQYGASSGLEMLFHLSNIFKEKKTTLKLIAHNGGKYDTHFIFKYLQNAKGIKKGSRFMTISGKFNNVYFELRDSCLMISMPLKSFNKTFSLGDTVKEVISYNMYNKTDCIQRKLIPISEGLEWVKNDGLDENQFLNNIEKWNLTTFGKSRSKEEGGVIEPLFDCVEYSRFYCEIDCDILEKGYNTFKKWMLELVEINIDEVLTLASLAHNFFINEGCYEGVNELAGTPQQFIQKCVVGGRVMCAENKKNMENKGTKIMDFDAVSLYPSAMKKMDGYLKGLPQVINNLDYNTIKNYDGYFIQITIKSVGIDRKFPLLSFVNEDGIRTFTNDMVGKTIFIDKIALEDAIEYQEIEFDVIRGYYFNQGFNDEINYKIQHVFNERKKLKAQKNPAEIVYKLIMNSAYGKSILKEIETEVQFFNDEEDMNVFISRNYNWVQNYEAIDDSKMWIMEKVNPINNHFNIAQVGVSILSWSKRIMNEVMCLAEDDDLDMFYQDTDSIHISADHIELLSKEYKRIYREDLIGENLGQFHSDFDLKGCENIYANRSIFLGKKCYIDELYGTDEKTGEQKIDYHIRMKGIPNSTIKNTAKNLGLNVYELYEKLYQGDAIKFDLTEGGAKANFKINKNGTINTLSFFEREICF